MSEVARYIPGVWDIATPEAAHAARHQGSVTALRRILGGLANAPMIARAADLATRAATSGSMHGRILYAALRSLPVPGEPLSRLFHAATLLREYRGDGHNAALVCAGIDGQEAHVLHAISQGVMPEKFGRLDPLTPTELAVVVDGLRARGLVDASATFTTAGRQTKVRIESVTDALAAPAYDSLKQDEIDQLIADLEPIRATIDSVGSGCTWTSSVSVQGQPQVRGPNLATGQLR